MLSEYLASEEVQKALEVLKNQFPLAIWGTVYVTLLSTLFAIVIGLPLGVLLVAGENKKSCVFRRAFSTLSTLS